MFLREIIDLVSTNYTITPDLHRLSIGYANLHRFRPLTCTKYVRTAQNRVLSLYYIYLLVFLAEIIELVSTNYIITPDLHRQLI